ncbi:MAG: hypothetical protein IPL97_00175 [Niastella sp.]|nr:hypothetical protein [Niastella sp.]
MLKFNEIKKGDFLVADNEGDLRRGEVTDLNGDEKQVCLNNGVQDFWYETNQLFPLEINDEELSNLKFNKQQNDDGTVKYSKGAFRMLIPRAGDFSHFELWYRDEKRHIMEPIPVHVLQNHFYEMTKVHLNNQSFD